MDKHAFNADPAHHPLRILVATDAAREIRAVGQRFIRPAPVVYMSPANRPTPSPARRSLMERINERPARTQASRRSLNNGWSGVRFMSESHDLMDDLFPSINTFRRTRVVDPVADVMSSFNQTARIFENPVAETFRCMEVALLPTKELFAQVAVTADYPLLMPDHSSVIPRWPSGLG